MFSSNIYGGPATSAKLVISKLFGNSNSSDALLRNKITLILMFGYLIVSTAILAEFIYMKHDGFAAVLIYCIFLYYGLNICPDVLNTVLDVTKVGATLAINNDGDIAKNLTIQIPVRNEPFDLIIRTSIHSALNSREKYPNLRVQVIDNSDQGMYELLKNYCNVNNIQFIHRDGIQGAKGRNLNLASLFSNATPEENLFISSAIMPTEYYFVVDADNSFDTDCPIKGANYLNDNPNTPFALTRINYIDCNYNEFNGNTDAFRFLYHIGSTKLALANRYSFVGANGTGLFLRHSLWKTIGGWQEKFAVEDWPTGVIAEIHARSLDPNARPKRIDNLAITDAVPSNLKRTKNQMNRWAVASGIISNRLLYLYIRSKNVGYVDGFSLFMSSATFGSTGLLSLMLPVLSYTSNITLEESIVIPILAGIYLLNNAIHGYYIGINSTSASPIKTSGMSVVTCLMGYCMTFPILLGFLKGYFDEARFIFAKNMTIKSKLQPQSFFEIAGENKLSLLLSSSLLALSITKGSPIVATMSFFWIISPFFILWKSELNSVKVK
jgi:hypothetical protein